MASKQPGQTITTPHNLPDHLTPFVGRSHDLAEITDLLFNPACRLLTLLGPGGIGKTRLATQAGSQLLVEFSHGVYFVSLQALEPPDLLLSAIAATLKFSLTDPQNPHLQLSAFLADKQLLLILDNFVHLLAAGPQLTGLLRETTGLKLLVTSREALNLQEEWLYQVDGLPYPSDDHPAEPERFGAAQLFVRCAQRVRPDFSLADEQAGVVEICRLAEGLTNPEIAGRLIIATGTVKYYTGQIYGKLGVRNRVEAVARGRELGLIEV